mgnify:CR=1 FL=1
MQDERHPAEETPLTVEQDDNAKVLVRPEQLIGYCIDERYRLESIVGGGGMGVVYRTHQQSLNREVAIKLLKLEDGQDTHRLERFRREIDIIAQLSHPNIVRVFDSGRDPKLGLSYIAMELVDGMPLDEVMHGHRIDAALALDIAHEVCAALTEPHALGIIHRDIKPANILVYPRSDDTIGVKVVDFGIARSGARSNSRITTTGVVVGSPMYMAPEVARGEELDARTDLYSLGVVLFEMISGVTPFRGSTPVAIMLRQAVDEPPSLATNLPADLQIPEIVELVDAMLAKDRRSRPDDARAVLRRIAEIRRQHQLGRPAIDGTKPLIPALGAHRIAVVDEEAEAEADPYSPTRPWREEDGPGSRTDSFHGWVIPETARQYLPGAPSEPAGSASDQLSPPRRRSPVIVAVAALLVALLGGTAFLALTRPPANEAPIQLGGEINAAPPIAVQEIAEEPPPDTPPKPLVTPTAAPDVGADGSSPETSQPPAEAVAKRPTAPPRPVAAPDDGPDVGGGGVENLDWILQK